MDSRVKLGIYEKAMPGAMSMEGKLRTAKEFGFDFMEMSIDETPQKLARLDMSKAERTELIRLMRETELPVRTICLSGHRKFPLGSADPDIRAKSAVIMRGAIGLAYDLGVRVIQIAGYDVYYEESTEATRACFLEGLRRSVEIAAEYGVVLAFETMETPFMNNVKKAMIYVREIASPYLQVYPDVGNCTNAAADYREDVVLDLMSGKGHIAAMHLKETAPGKYREVEFGNGHVDFERVIRAALAMGVRLFVTEFWENAEIEYREHIRYSKKFIDEKFAKAKQAVIKS